MIAFLLTPLGRYLAIALVAMGAIGGEYAYLRVHFYNAGYAAAINAIAAKNKEATDAVNQATKNVDDCVAHNGNWNTVSGVCE